MQSTHRRDSNPTHVRNKSLTGHDTLTPPAMSSLHGQHSSTRRISSSGDGRRNTLLSLPAQESARVIRTVSRDDLIVRVNSSVALGTGQARNMTTIGSIRYRPSKTLSNPHQKMENTYRMEPVMSFRSSRAEEIIRSVFRDILHPLSSYPEKPEEARHLVKMAANEIRNRTRMLNCDRYKIVVLVNIGERAGQSVRVVSRCLWAVTVDTWASATFEQRNIFASGTVFAVYTE